MGLYRYRGWLWGSLLGALLLLGSAGAMLAPAAGAAILAAGGSATSPLRPLEVVPFPGTPDASPSSQIIFSSLRPGELSFVLVFGSRSGRHRGRLIGLPDGAGMAF